MVVPLNNITTAVTLILSQWVTAQNNHFKGSFRLVKHQDLGKSAILNLDSCALGKQGLHSMWNFIVIFTELHVHGHGR